MTEAERGKINAIFGQLRARGNCFDLMCDFFDRAESEGNTALMESSWNQLDKIHRGDSR